MDDLARIKPNMAVLRRDILPMSPFGLLSRAFTEDILRRFESGTGFYPMYELELLQQEEAGEGETAPTGINLEIQLRLILQQLRAQDGSSAERRILEKVERLQLLREKTVVRREPAPSPGRMAAPRTRAAQMGADRAGGHLARESAPYGGPARGQPAHGQSAQRRYSYGLPAGSGQGPLASGRMTHSPWMDAPSVSPQPGQGQRPHGRSVSGPMAPMAGGGMRGSQGNDAPRRDAERHGPAAQSHGPGLGILHPTVEGLPGLPGPMGAELQFLTPGEGVDAQRGHTVRPGQGEDGLLRQLERSAAQMADGIARAAARIPAAAERKESLDPQRAQGTRTERRGEAARADDSPRKKAQRQSAQQGRPGRREDEAAIRPRPGVGTEESEGLPRRQANADAPHMEAISGEGRPLPVTGEIKRQTGGRFDSLTDLNWTMSGAGGGEPTARQNMISTGGEALSGVPGYLPMTLEHAEAERTAALTEQAVPGQGDAARLAKALDTAARSIRENPAAVPSGGPAAAGPIRERPAAASSGGSAVAHSIRENSAAAPSGGPAAVVPIRENPAAVPSGGPAAGRTLTAPVTGKPAARPVGTAPADRIHGEGHFGTAQWMSHLPLTLEHRQEGDGGSGPSPAETPGLSPQVLEKLLDTPGLRTLSRQMAALAHRSERGAAPRTGEGPRSGRSDFAAPGLAAGTGGMGGAGIQAKSKGTPDTVGVRPSAGAPGRGVPAMGLTHGPVGMGSEDAALAMMARPPVELAHMEPSSEALSAAATPSGGGAAIRREAAALEGLLRKELQRSGTDRQRDARPSGQGTISRPSGGAGQSPGGAGSGLGRGLTIRGSGQMTASRFAGGVIRGWSGGAPGGMSRIGSMPEGAWTESMSVYPALSMEYGGPVVAMARELHRTVAREMGQRTAAALAMEEKAAPEPMQTVEVVTPPQLQQQVVWQNPYMRSGPSEMTHHQKNTPVKTQQSQPQPRMSDAEIRRTADKVFKLVQEKIIAERRRTGRL